MKERNLFINKEINKSIIEATIVILLLFFGIVAFSFIIPTQTYEKTLNVLSEILYWITLPF